MTLRIDQAVFLFVCTGFALAGRASDVLPAAEPVLARMEQVADWQLAHPTRHDPKEWVQGAFYTGLMALTDISASERFEEAMIGIGEANAWGTGADPYNSDDQVVGQAYVELFLKERKPERIGVVKENIDYVLGHPKELWYWCDALFMGPPTWARLAAATGERAYLDYALSFWEITTALLYDEEEKLYYRDESFIGKRGENGAKIFWSRGNGWVLAGLARMLQFLPAEHAARAAFESQFRAMAARIVGLQQADGMWRGSLLEPEFFSGREASGTGFFCYALAWGVNQGLLERADYEPAIRRAWSALERCVDEDGRLAHVQPIGAAPEGFPADSSEPYGVGAFLLAGSEVYRLAGGEVPARIQGGASARRTWTRGVDDRGRWVALAGRMADPVLYALARRQLKTLMPVEAINPAERALCTHLEALGRLLAGLAPWIELGDDGTAEGWERARVARLARRAIDAATDPASPDYMNFNDGAQPLVDAAFLAQALLRSPTELVEKLEPHVRANLTAALKSTRTIQPYPGNWLLFASMVEVGLERLGEPREPARLFEGLERFQEWYLGDGIYGDGAEYRWDYYNAYVIQPMLVELLAIVGDETPELSAFRASVFERAKRFAAIQERLIAPDGSFPAIGRSIAYRGAALQGLAQSALRHALPDEVSPGQARTALTAVIRRTLEAPGTFHERGWLKLGLAGHQPSLAEHYVSTGSLYLCSVAFQPLGLPATDPFWTAPQESTTWEKIWSGVDWPPDQPLKRSR